MFERPQHRRVALVLQALNANLLRTHRRHFGGGTAIVLRNREYRESADIDKPLANADRWADRSTFSRDLIDLAMLAPPPTLLDTAIAKAATPYGASIERCPTSAIDCLADDSSRLGECMRALQMFDTPKAILWQHITTLRR
ncbi:MAG: hypothetical protein AB7G47_00065 [Mycolicibacterium sp.]|uniref:hypothetical protein n=1 Tax=Mycolicibacterium sp. TaxID=2320850 RepID=UPI003D11E6C0